MSKQKTYLIILFTVFVLGLGLIIISIKPSLNLVNQQLPKFYPTQTPSVLVSLEQTKVKRIIDGDTIELTDNRRVRYIGINTPEIVDPIRPVECFGKEAVEKNKELVSEKNVLLERDISDVDKYGRLLRYVYVQDSQDNKTMINEKLVSDGYAKADTYKPDIKYQEVFAEAQQIAKNNNLGLWGNCGETIRW